MAKESSIQEIQAEIESLEQDEFVKLANREYLALRQKLYKLRWLQKKGREIAAAKKKEAGNGARE